MYIFSFRPNELNGVYSKYSYSYNKKRITNSNRKFNLRYLNSTIKKGNYSIIACGESKLHKVLLKYGQYDNPLLGHWLTTESAEHAMYLRLGIEDLTNKRANITFTKGYVFDEDELVKNVVDIEKQIDEKEKLIDSITRKMADLSSIEITVSYLNYINKFKPLPNGTDEVNDALKEKLYFLDDIPEIKEFITNENSILDTQKSKARAEMSALIKSIPEILSASSMLV